MALDRGDLLAGLRFLGRFPAALRSRVGHEQALACVRERLEHRQRDFLRLLREAIYDRPRHPSRRLLERAGCAFGDVERLVASDGVEGTLGILSRAGVYLTADHWESVAAFEHFQAGHGDAYRQLDAELEGVAGMETFVGAFELVG